MSQSRVKCDSLRVCRIMRSVGYAEVRYGKSYAAIKNNDSGEDILNLPVPVPEHVLFWVKLYFVAMKYCAMVLQMVNVILGVRYRYRYYATQRWETIYMSNNIINFHMCLAVDAHEDDADNRCRAEMNLGTTASCRVM
jgi:hypothetical protein